MTAADTVVRIERTIPAPPNRVYQAWLQPELLRQWLAPGGLEVARMEVDVRVGGHFRIWHTESGTDVGGFDCQILELVPDRRIVFRWGFVGPQRRDAPAYDSLLTVALDDAPGGGTRLTLVHERLAELAAAMPHVAVNVGPGWRSALDKLRTAVTGSPYGKESDMRKVIVTEWMSLDGVAQAPGTPDEDTSGGFRHGGWHLRYFDDASRAWVVDNLAKAGGFLFGRYTYERFAAHWPHVTGEERVIAEPLNSKPKYIASTTLAGPLAWANSTVLPGDVVEAVRALRREDGDDLLVIGSLRLVHTLIEHDLVDELRLMIDPLILGGGKRTFGDHGVPRELRLVSCRETTTGALLATYAREAG